MSISVSLALRHVFLFVAIAAQLALAQSTFAQPIEVLNSGDEGGGTLRQAILDANDNIGPDQIVFAIPGDGPHIIQPLSPLPHIMGTVEINGYSQAGAAANTAVSGSNATIRIVLDGSLASEDSTGVSLFSSGNRISGLSIVNWLFGIDTSFESDANEIVGNFIGINPDGSPARIAIDGISLDGSANLVGTPALADRNVIGNSGHAIEISFASDGNVIQNNVIGLDPSTSIPALVSSGIRIHGNNNSIGGTGMLEGNLISGARYVGVQVLLNQGNTIRGNSIFDNGHLGIDLDPVGGLFRPDGVTENDPVPDNDMGPNGLQNFPILIAAENNAGMVDVLGVLDSAPNTEYLIDFYSNEKRDEGPADVDGDFHGEGQSYLGSLQVMTDGTGSVDFEALGLSGQLVGPWISATATDPQGNTSEFSETIFIRGDECEVTNTNPDGAGSLTDCLQQAAANSNEDEALDVITFPFNPGTTPIIPHVPNAPPFSRNVLVDFSSHPDFVPRTAGTPPCADNAIRPITLDTGGADIDLNSGVWLRGANFNGSILVPAGVNGAVIEFSTISAALPGAALFLDGDHNNVVDSVFTAMGSEPAVDTFGSSNWVSGSCATGAPGISLAGFPPVGAVNNTLSQSQVTTLADQGVVVFGTFGNEIRDTRISVSPPRQADGPAPGVAIDLGDDGHTENDMLDEDGGANGLQNHPVITSATTLSGAATTEVEGTLDSKPGAPYVVQVYASSACASGDYGPSERFLGDADVTTDAGGHADFSIQLAAATASGEVVTATATDAFGSTSELSACFEVMQGNPDILLRNGFE